MCESPRETSRLIDAYCWVGRQIMPGIRAECRMGLVCSAAHAAEEQNPKLRPFVLVGDGAFQMTGTELSTAVRLGLKPIVFVLNNGGYGTMRKIRDGSFNVISQWDYQKICELVGGGVAMCATTRGELDGAIRSAMGSNGVRVIEVRLPRDTMSPQLANMTAEMAKMRGAKTMEAAT